MFPIYDENKSRTLPIITWILIVVNSLVFWWEFTQGFEIPISILLIPAYVLQGKQLFSLATSMFLHADFWHLLGNMVYLFVFGDNVEDRFGHIKYLLFYFAFGILGGITHSISAVWGNEGFTPTLGASGAVSGVLGAYLVFFPRARIVSIVPSFYFVRLARVPASIFIGFWFVLQFLYSGNTAVAYMAHIGGFLLGLILALIFRFNRSGLRTKYPRFTR